MTLQEVVGFGCGGLSWIGLLGGEDCLDEDLE